MGEIATENFEKVEVATGAELRAWLVSRHAQDDSVWLVTYKKSANPDKYVSREEVLDELLCFGWIDGIRRKLDDERTMQLISRRKARHWAKSYKERVARLTEAGRMHAAGLAAVEEGKQKGLWTFMDDVDALIVPDDLAAKLGHGTRAARYYESCPPSYRRNLLRWLKLAKTDKTRQKRLSAIQTACASEERIPNM